MFCILLNFAIATTWVGRPQVYWGVRTKELDGLLAGLIWWHGAKVFLRHTCDNAYESSYYYDKHDGENYSNEILNDEHAVLNVEWAQTGDEWVAQITGKQKPDGATGLAFYLGSDAKGSEFEYEEHPEMFGYAGNHKKEKIALYFQGGVQMIKHTGFNIEPGRVWTVQNVYEKEAIATGNVFYPSHMDDHSNVAFHRLAYNGDFNVTIAFTKNGVKGAKKLFANFPERAAALKADFDERFATKFDVSASTSKLKKGNKLFSDEYLKYAQIAIASTNGGIGFFTGNSIIDKTPLVEDDYDPYDSQFADFFDEDNALSPEVNTLGHRKDKENPELTEVRELYSSTPSRSFFPRGFIWDEGFHLLMIGKFNENTGLDILESWFNIMDKDGWIAREQILGDEARSKVPTDFQTQYTYVGNPPTLIIAVAALLERGQKIDAMLANKDTKQFEIDTFEYKQQQELKSIYSRVATLYPKLVKNYEWFLNTQQGAHDQYDRKYDNKFVFRWRGRTETHLFGSGMDDYPRAVPAHPGELHLDLLSWMTYYAKLLNKIATTMNIKKDIARFKKDFDVGIQNLENIFYDDDAKSYCDLTINVDGKTEHVCHEGYLTLYPLLLGLIPKDSAHLKPVLTFLKSPKVWTEYGIRSLSVQDEFSHQGENYWRGPIWIQMNYLICGSLYKNYLDSKEKELAVEIYGSLRHNLVTNIFSEFSRTGFFWEQYSDEDGHGQRAKPFTGWSALASLLLFESYDGV